VLPLVVDGLIGRLRSPSPGVRRRAAASLAGLGPPAVPAVLGALSRGRNVLVRRRLAAVLAEAGRGLDPEQRRALVEQLERVMATAEREVGRACAAAIAALSPGGGRPPGTAG
jgi:HEAT repeat protein